MGTEAENREAYRIQQRYCAGMGAPVYARLCGALAVGLTRDSRFGARILDWAGEPTADALPLRSIAGLHALVRAGADADLTRAFAGEIDDSALAWVLGAAMIAHDAALLPWLDGPPQTNEPARCAVLMTGLIDVAARHHARLEVIEIGSSAGLNLLVDRYRFVLGGRGYGPARAPVVIAPAWHGPQPAAVAPVFTTVSGCDIRPLDATDPAVAARLAAYVWPEQRDRGERLDAAIALLRAHGVDLVRADAADWVEARLAMPQAAGVTRVLMHSVVWQYLPAATQHRIRAAMAAAGARADALRPLGWVMMEPDRMAVRQVIAARDWPGSEAWRVLGTAHAHGAWIHAGAADAAGVPYALPPASTCG